MVFGKKCLPNDFLKLKRKSNKEERFSKYLGYQIPVTQLKGQKRYPLLS